MSNALSGRSSLSYQGTNASNPPNVTYSKNSPTQYDSQNVSLCDLWIDTTTNAAYILVSLAGTATSGGPLAIWSLLGFSSSELEYLEGNDGVQVGPNGSGIIFVKGDGTTITINGNAATNTLTASLVPGAFTSSLTGNSGGAVAPNSSGNINVVGDGTTITIAGNPSTHTLTASVLSSVNLTLTGNSGGAVSPTANNINVVGDGTTITITGNPGTHTLTASIASGGALDTITGNTGGAVSPNSMGNINLLGTAGVVSVTGNNATHTLTIAAGSEVATTYDADSGSATPSSNILTIAGGTNINTSGSGSTVTVNLDTTLTGITNVTVNNLTVNTSETLGYLGAGVVQTNSSGQVTSNEGTDGQVLIGSSTGAPAWANITAGSNVTITNGHNSIQIAATGGSGSAGLIFLASIDVTGLTTVQFTSLISSTYNSYMLVADRLVIPAPQSTAAAVNMEYSSNNGATYYTSVSVGGVSYSAYNSTSFSNYNTGSMPLAPFFVSSDPQYVSFTYFLYDLPGTGFIKAYNGQFTTYQSGGANLYTGYGAGGFLYGGVTGGIAVNAIRVFFGGAFTSGTIELYGLTI